MDIGTLTGTIELEDKFSSALDRVADKIKEKAKESENLWGTMTLGALGAAAAIGGVTAAIIGLGNRGADVNDVTSTFEHFSGSVENAAATMEKMQKGTLNTVDDMDLMKDASKLLAAGVHLTSDQFGTLSQAAFVLQNQGLGPTKDMLDLVSQALLTGRTRTLEMKIGKIDLAKAEKDYAASLGVEKLTRMEKVEADRIAILDALNRKVKEAGEQHRDFGETMEAAVVAVKNWGDEVAAAVARSPQVMAAVNAIGDAIIRNFGGAGKTALETIVNWINKFADAVRVYGPPIIDAMADVINKVKEIYNEITYAWNTAPEWFKNIAKEATIAAVAVKGVSYASHEMTGQDVLTNLASLANIYQGLSLAASKALPWLNRVGAALQLYYLLGSGAGGGVTGGIAQVLTGIGGALGTLLVPAAVLASITALAASVWKLVEAWNAWKKATSEGTSTGTFLLRKDNDNFVRRMLGLSTENMPTAPKAPSTNLPSAVRGQLVPGAGGPTSLGGLNISSGTLTDIRPTKVLSEADSAAIEEYNKKLEAMQQKFKDASLQSRLFADTFKSLTAAQKSNYDVQQMLVPELEKMLEAHRTLTPEMQRVLKTSTDVEQSFLNQEQATLKLTDVTQESVDRAKEVGFTEAQIAANYGVSTKALELYLATQKKELTITQSLASFQNALVEDQRAAKQRQEDIEKQGNKALGDSHKELLDLINQQTMTSAQYQAQQVKQNEADKIAAFKGTKEQAIAYMDDQAAIAHERYAQIAMDEAEWAAKGDEDLQQSLGDQVHSWAEAMTQIAQISGDAFGGVIKDIANVVASWDMAIQAADAYHSAINKTQKAMAAVQGAMAVWQGTGQGSIGARVTGGALAGASAGAMFGPWGAAIGGIGGAVVGLIRGIKGLTDYQKAMRAAAAETENLHQNLIKSHGSMERLAMDADMVGINIKEAMKWKDPEALKNVISDLDAKTQLLNDAMQEYGFTWADLGDKFRAAKLGDLFDELKAKTDILQGAGIDYDEILRRQASSYSDLVEKAIKSGTEIPESMKGTLQKLQEMGLLFTEVKDEQGNVTKNFLDLKDVSWAKTMSQGFDEVTAAIKDLTDALINGVGGAMDKINGRHVKIYADTETSSSGTTEPEYHATGGKILAWRPRGTDVVPAMLTPGETVIPAGRSADTPIAVPVELRVGSEVLAKQVVKTFVRGGL